MLATNLISKPVGVARILSRSCLLALLAFGLATAATPISANETDDLSALLDEIAATDVVLVGPVEALNRSQGSLRVLGQQVRVPSTIDRGIKPGALALVRGAIADDGSVTARSVGLISDTYIAGSTQVLIRGRVTAVKPAFGTLRVGNLRVDYTSSLYSLDGGAVANGSLVLLAGIQPQAGGVLLAQAKLSNVPNSIIGSDTQSIIGSDTQSIIGSDTQSIIGSDTQSIIGSDTQSIIGSDTQSIIGSDTQSIIGSDTQSIIGSDTQSIIGSDTQSIIGSDTQSIIGSD